MLQELMQPFSIYISLVARCSNQICAEEFWLRKVAGFNPMREETQKFLSNLAMNYFVAMVMRNHLDRKMM